MNGKSEGKAGKRGCWKRRRGGGKEGGKENLRRKRQFKDLKN